MGSRSKRALFAGWIAIAVLAGCGDDGGPVAQGSPATGSDSIAGSGSAAGPTALVERGRAVYNTNCIACHARNPAEEGGLGPAIAGSSRELVEARVLRGEYPPGYTPKRATALMIPLPHLAPDIDAIVAYLSTADDS